MNENLPQQILQGTLSDPHNALGLCTNHVGEPLIRVWKPGATALPIDILGKTVESTRIHPSGLFEHVLNKAISPLDYKIPFQNGELFHDPYAFSSRLGELDLHLLKKGVHYELYNLLGATLVNHQGIEGVHFALWAPNATGVSVIGDFNGFDAHHHPMRLIEDTGVWELFVPGLKEGTVYQFSLWTKEGKQVIKTDPVGHYFQLRPEKESVVYDLEKWTWSDERWLEQRKARQKLNQPISIYEIHPGSWRKKGNELYNWRELAPLLIDYCLAMRFTHIELMGVCEHPLDESWGYQVTGYFGPTSRYGTPEDFQFFINELHRAGIGVFLDWVPAHFPKDDHSLAQFDGTFLYEHKDPRQGFHPDWNTHIFNYGRYEVSNFLIASAFFWIEKMHIDGLRVDAVSSMLRLDYSREEGEWIPNQLGTNVNLEAVDFLKHLNDMVHKKHPDVLMIAEESDGFPKLTTPVENGGIGFDLKWSLGWMHDTLDTLTQAVIDGAMNTLKHITSYIFEENSLLVLSHDEVVHEKNSLLNKFPGSDEEKVAALSQLYTWLLTFPGKKLLFMGGEFGQKKEWNCTSQLDWDLLEERKHASLQQRFATLNFIYSKYPALYETDCEQKGLVWVESQQNGVVVFFRKNASQTLLCAHNFGQEAVQAFIPKNYADLRVKECFSSHSEQWGDCDKIQKASELVLEGKTSKIFEVLLEQTSLFGSN